MSLDIRSLYLMSMLVALSLACITLYFGWGNQQYRSIRDWGWSTLMIAIGQVLLMMQGVVSSLISQALADTLLLSGVTLAYRSFRVYRGEPTGDPVGWLTVGLVAGVLALGDGGIASASARSAMVTGVMGALLWRISWRVGSRPLPLAQTAQRFTAMTYFLFGALFMMRSASTVFRPSEDFALMTASLVEIVMVGGSTMLWVSATLGIMWMTLERQQADLVRMATRDPLTNALNRNALVAEFEREKYRCSRNNGSFAVALFDIDHFKRFNDTYGHLVGDEVLRSLVASLKGVVRKNDLVGRYGGEEFVILMPDADPSSAGQVAERARSRIEAEGFFINGVKVPMTVSAGIAVFPGHGAEWDDLLGAADAAMYQAKSGGRNRVMFATGCSSAVAVEAAQIPG